MENRAISAELRYLSKMIMRYMEAHNGKKKLEKTTGMNCFVISYIGEKAGKDVFQRDLEKEFGITRSTASKNIDLMVRKGYIEREPVDYDARLKKLVLTEKSLAVLENMRAGRAEFEKTLTKGFSDAEKDNLRQYIARLTENIKSVPEENE